MGLFVAINITGQIPYRKENYSGKVRYAHLWAGVSSVAAGVAGGLAIGMTRKPTPWFAATGAGKEQALAQLATNYEA